AKAMAKEAGVPFLFVSSTAFQSMWYGATSRKIRAYFRQLRNTARIHGGAIGFIEEIDAIATRRGGLSGSSPAPGVAQATSRGLRVDRAGVSEGVGGVVNELLIQMQSFDEPTRKQNFYNGFVRFLNRYLPAHRALKTKVPSFANVLLIGATNRADSLDPALLRPGRFDRILHFDVPGRTDRRELVDYFLQSKAHEDELDVDSVRDDLAGATMGYTPASLERLFDEALLVAMRHDRRMLSLRDLRKAQLEVEIGLPQRTEYPSAEKETIAVHEAGHATVAYLVGKSRKPEVLSIIKRRDALGLLAHRDCEERFTRGDHEMQTLLQIALGGMVAEEVFFGESGTGPAGDLMGATQLASDMVGSYGLGDSLISFRAIETGLMGGNLTARILADKTARENVNTLLNDAKHEVTRLLTDHRHIVVALRDALIEHEEILENQILETIRLAEAQALADSKVVVDIRDSQNPTIASEIIELEPLPDGLD
ncbi:MAG: AAA family ATPase, partial [Acidimicrobiia bacterium]|nr:AAA family ATPase [Acidimicrobiia bacterium]